MMEILVSVAATIYILESVYIQYKIYEQRQHDKYCEDCLDQEMAESFKRMRNDEEEA